MPRNLRDVSLCLQRGHHGMQMLDVAQVHVDDEPVEIRLSVGESQVGDIGLLFADQGADATKHARVVGNRDIERNGVDRGVAAGMPLQVDPAGGLLF